MKRTALALALCVPSCLPWLSGGTTPTREACYESARATYWAGVEDCKAKGLTVQTCPLDQLGAQLQRDQEACP